MEADRGPSPLYMVKQVEQVIRFLLEELLRPDGMTTAQYTALSVLARTDGLTSADLARRSFVRAQSAADLVAAMTKQGLITREPDPTNRRRLLISLTPYGRETLEGIESRTAAIEERMLAGFSDGERTAFRDMLVRARQSLAEEAVGR